MKHKKTPLKGLEISEDVAFQEGNWVVERVAWGVMAFIVLAALLGVFAAGPLSNARRADASGGLEVSYQRFLRVNAPALIKIGLKPDVVKSGFAIELDEAFGEAFRLETVFPAPERWVSAGKSARLEFNALAPQEAVIRLHIDPIKAGLIEPGITLPGSSTLKLPILVYP